MSSKIIKVCVCLPMVYEMIHKPHSKYVGTCHGFAARPNLSDPEIKAGFEGAFEQGVAWFQKHLAV